MFPAILLFAVGLVALASYTTFAVILSVALINLTGFHPAVVYTSTFLSLLFLFTSLGRLVNATSEVPQR